MAVIPSVDPRTFGQNGITLYALDRYERQVAQGQEELAAAMAPVTPAIVQAPATTLPSTIIKQLPTIAAASAGGAARTLGAGRCDRLQSRDIEVSTSNWLCALGAWVSAHPVMALGLVAGTYVMARGK